MNSFLRHPNVFYHYSWTTYHFLTLFPSSKWSVKSTRIITTPIAFMLAHPASVEDQLMQIASDREETIIAIVSIGADFTSDQVVSWNLFLMSHITFALAILYHDVIIRNTLVNYHYP